MPSTDPAGHLLHPHSAAEQLRAIFTGAQHADDALIAALARQLLAEYDELGGERDRMFLLIADLVDDGECRFDHHGGCQEHGYLELEPGELCPHAEAKQLLAEHEPAAP